MFGLVFLLKLVLFNNFFIDNFCYCYNSIEETCEERSTLSKLYRAALDDDWQTAETIFDSHEDYVKASLSKLGETALHVAASAGRIDFVKNLLGYSPQVLKLTDYFGQTALSLAAASGNLDLVQLMTEDNEHLALDRESVDQYLPIHAGAMSGHKEVVLYLYSITEGQLDNKDLIELLIILIKTDLYEVALRLFKDHPQLATLRDSNEETALHALAGKSMMSSYLANQNQQGMLQNFFSSANVGSTKLSLSHTVLEQAITLVEIIWKEVIRSQDSEISTLIERPFQLTFVAAEKGNIEFLRVLIREYPYIISKHDDMGRTMFHIAVLNHQVKILELINEMGSMKDRIVSRRDYGGNNILHMAGMQPSNEGPNVVFGAVLQLQQEVLWFKKVSEIVRPVDAEARNYGLQTPRELFTQSHRSLIEDGQKWMRETADSCMVVATLVATVVFAAAFTIPGGNKGDTGVPIFIEEASFIAFAISDAVGLVFSATSILTFLSIRSSVYSEEDFLWRVPGSLASGLASLFMSIAAMMVVFCATSFTIFHGRLPWLPVLVTVISSIPVLLFIRQYHRFFANTLGVLQLSSFV
ncbi:ANK REP REGION domain-containing protein [Citrus sinensis]|nr:ANK REP REGION domain-containing protein [Citrus sinensis]